MFELFLALFGGAYLWRKYVTDKRDIEDANENLDRMMKRRKAFADKMTDNTGLEITIGMYIDSGKNVNEIFESLGANLRRIFGDDYRNKCVIPGSLNISTTPGVLNHTYWVKQLLLAKHGKVSNSAIQVGYPMGNENSYELTIAFAKEIERCLRDAGVYVEIVEQKQTMLRDGKYIVDWRKYGAPLVFIETAISETRRLW